MQRLNSKEFAERWKKIPKKCEENLIIGRVFSTKECNVIRRLQAHNIVSCLFKTSENVTSLYLSCTTKDNILILMEIVLVNSGFLSAKIKYKSESQSKHLELENLLMIILSDCAEDPQNDEIMAR